MTTPAPSGKPTVLVVDDDPRLRELATGVLGEEYSVVTAENGQAGVRAFFERRPDLVLLDVTMPGMNGIEVCRRIREMAQTPVIMVTAHGEDADVARGLDAGADDYVVKPFRPVELLARIRASLRRAPRAGGAERFSLQDGALVIDTGRRAVIVRGEEVKVSATEYKMLETLARHAGQVLSHDQILDSVWGYAYAGETGYVKTYVGLIRNKIEEDPSRPKFLLSRRGLGYYLEPRAGAAG
ncbi:MAG TPA: response regulator transcription factor [Chloroflexota bacterium]|nr:response regulator transcription factor [Chloroflexota bacterium]